MMKVLIHPDHGNGALQEHMFSALAASCAAFYTIFGNGSTHNTQRDSVCGSWINIYLVTWPLCVSEQEI